FESRPGNGTTVRLQLDISELTVAREEVKKGTLNDRGFPPAPTFVEQSVEDENNRSVSAATEVNWMKKVLVVEDNPDLRQYLRRLLRPAHEVSEACNGKIGLQKAREELPDLIISDLMMPEMDGIEFIRELKDDIKTSYIPVIILTAKSDSKIQAQLYRIGVEAFITKPFNSEIFQTRIESILRQRERLHAIYRSSLFAVTNLQMQPDQTSPKDRECLDKLMAYLEEHLSASDITVEDLCSVSGFTYSLLYKKLKNPDRIISARVYLGVPHPTGRQVNPGRTIQHEGGRLHGGIQRFPLF
ncbi:MAG: response regulator, partial [Rikenellaceae bacterium]|nr:response regulator [Rikenellaceae bacterium]